ncbi:hypothetical protein LZ32DRAFT_98143 [Colletotrichum eremochloae]|nr:hypothetical protein LZ32DRAFT_98143 [Colletotrichum eremochloae]
MATDEHGLVLDTLCDCEAPMPTVDGKWKPNCHGVLYHAVLYHALPMLTRARTLGLRCQTGKETHPSEDNPYVKTGSISPDNSLCISSSALGSLSVTGVELGWVMPVGHQSAPTTTSRQRARDGTGTGKKGRSGEGEPRRILVLHLCKGERHGSKVKR